MSGSYLCRSGTPSEYVHYLLICSAGASRRLGRPVPRPAPAFRRHRLVVGVDLGHHAVGALAFLLLGRLLGQADVQQGLDDHRPEIGALGGGRALDLGQAGRQGGLVRIRRSGPVALGQQQGR